MTIIEMVAVKRVSTVMQWRKAIILGKRWLKTANCVFSDGHYTTAPCATHACSLEKGHQVHKLTMHDTNVIIPVPCSAWV